ncbi:TadE/TadG family type IV pilus assembly protein [Pinisolibacter sp.]|uniref:TadE/TadG family type IV pilus assembly protein n=1 Tax=Pinisolibacter sp. TaxID=2172024 RepID=UPI002FDE5E75
MFFLKKLEAFGRDRSGAIAVLIGLVGTILFVAVGVTLDVIEVFNLRSRLQYAADAAALTGAITARDSSSGGAQASDRAIAQTVANTHFAAANIAGATGASTITYAANLVTSTYDWQGAFAPRFSRIIGIDTWPVSGSSSAKVAVSQPGYVDIYFVIDASHSMAIGATAADQSVMMNKIGCTIGCHLATGSDTISKARTAGATLRFDVIKSAITSILAKTKTIQAAAISAGRGPVIRIAFLTYSNTMKTPFALSSDLTAATTALSSLDVDTAVGQTGTNFHTLFSSLNAVSMVNGDGKTAAKPKSFVILMTDGVEDSVIQTGTGGTKVGRDPNFVNYSPYDRETSMGFNWDIQGFDPTLCATLKSKGTNLMTLNVEYLVPTLSPDSGDPRYLFVKNTLKSKIQTNMATCATSSEMALYASSSSDITTAVDKLFSLALASAVYLSK